MQGSEVQPIDGYVRGVLNHAKERFGLDIDPDHPTRAQRLEAAVALHDEANGFSSMEIMVGRRVDGSEPFAQTFAMLKMSGADADPKRFYGGFAHQYWPTNK